MIETGDVQWCWLKKNIIYSIKIQKTKEFEAAVLLGDARLTTNTVEHAYLGFTHFVLLFYLLTYQRNKVTLQSFTTMSLISCCAGCNVEKVRKRLFRIVHLTDCPGPCFHGLSVQIGSIIMCKISLCCFIVGAVLWSAGTGKSSVVFLRILAPGGDGGLHAWTKRKGKQFANP